MKRIFGLAGPSQEPITITDNYNSIVEGLVTSDITPRKSFVQSPGRVHGVNLSMTFQPI